MVCAFAESVRLLVTVEYQITRGDLGLAAPLLFGTPRATPYYYLFLGLALVALLVAWQIVHSRIGAYLRAIRDDEEAAATMGVDTFKWKRFAFVVYGIVYAYVGISFQVMREIDAFTGGLAYVAISGTIVILSLIVLARRFAREE